MSLGIKKKRVSKKTKQSWRKHIDLKDVDDFMEEVRFDERVGYVFFWLCFFFK